MLGERLAALRAFPALLEDLILDPRGEVDATIIVAVGRVGRDIDLTRSEREPADRRAAFHAERLPKLGAAHEGDQCRRVDGLLLALRRHPEPAIVALGPAAIVVGREAPRLLVDPGPAVGLRV